MAKPTMYNPDFNYPEFGVIKNESGLKKAKWSNLTTLKCSLVCHHLFPNGKVEIE
jgi:hypothetical protein